MSLLSSFAWSFVRGCVCVEQTQYEHHRFHHESQNTKFICDLNNSLWHSVCITNAQSIQLFDIFFVRPSLFETGE